MMTLTISGTDTTHAASDPWDGFELVAQDLKDVYFHRLADPGGDVIPMEA